MPGDKAEYVRVLYNATLNGLSLMSILVSAIYPLIDLSAERLAPRRVASESRTSCPTLYRTISKPRRTCSEKELACGGLVGVKGFQDQR
jgi:hypothetical protein